MYPSEDRYILGHLIKCCELTNRLAEAAVLSQFIIPSNISIASRLLIAGCGSMDYEILEFICEPELLEIMWCRAAQQADQKKQCHLMALVQNQAKLQLLRPQIKAKCITYLRERLT